ncbi:MAG: enoyl-CoA hydratase [Spongiibacteraceae bacterium]
MAIVEIQREGAVALITLNRPEARNALNAALAQAICDAMAVCQDASAIVLTGAGTAFCAGLDLKNLGVEKLSDLPNAIDAPRLSAVPVIAAINGPAVTGGFEMALACDFMIGSERAAFADTHVRVGVFPGPVLIDLPRRIGMAKAREMSLTGNFIDAKTALNIGLLNHLVPHDELVPQALKLAHDMAGHDVALIKTMRQAWDATAALPYTEARTVRDDFSLRSGSGERRAGELAARREQVIERAKHRDR